MLGMCLIVLKAMNFLRERLQEICLVPRALKR